VFLDCYHSVVVFWKTSIGTTRWKRAEIWTNACSKY